MVCGFLLVGFDADMNFLRLQNVADYLDSKEQIAGLLEKEQFICSQVRFALAGVDDEHMHGLRRLEFHVCGKAGSSESDNAGLSDSREEFLSGKRGGRRDPRQ